MRLPSYPEAMVAHLDGVPVVAHTDGAPRPQAARCPACMGSLTTRPRSRVHHSGVRGMPDLRATSSTGGRLTGSGSETTYGVCGNTSSRMLGSLRDPLGLLEPATVEVACRVPKVPRNYLTVRLRHMWESPENAPADHSAGDSECLSIPSQGTPSLQGRMALPKGHTQHNTGGQKARPLR